MKTFEVRRNPIEFEIAPETYTAGSLIPADTLAELSDIFAAMSETNSAGLSKQYEQIKEILGKVLLDESYDRFIPRLKDKVNGIDFATLTEVVGWIIGEATGGRPTQPSSSSGDTPESDGANSTDGVPPAESIPGT